MDVQLELVHRLGFCSLEEHERLRARIDEIGRMLNDLITALQPKDE